MAGEHGEDIKETVEIVSLCFSRDTRVRVGMAGLVHT